MKTLTLQEALSNTLIKQLSEVWNNTIICTKDAEDVTGCWAILGADAYPLDIATPNTVEQALKEAIADRTLKLAPVKYDEAEKKYYKCFIYPASRYQKNDPELIKNGSSTKIIPFITVTCPVDSIEDAKFILNEDIITRFINARKKQFELKPTHESLNDNIEIDESSLNSALIKEVNSKFNILKPKTIKSKLFGWYVGAQKGNTIDRTDYHLVDTLTQACDYMKNNYAKKKATDTAGESLILFVFPGLRVNGKTTNIVPPVIMLGSNPKTPNKLKFKCDTQALQKFLDWMNSKIN